MKKVITILNICIMTNISIFGQAGLKNGVYEFLKTDTTGIKKETIRRTLTVKHNAALYAISNSKVLDAASFHSSGDYYLKLEKHSALLYSAKNENIGLNITVAKRNTVRVEAVTGRIRGIYSGGAYFDDTIDLQPEKYTLTFVRELTAEDEEKLLQNAEMKLSQTVYLNEEWHFETKDGGNLITVSHTFGESGKYEYRRSETFDMYTQNARGTYRYQPETNEIFIHIDESLENAITGIYAPMRDFKQYLKILECSDTAVTALQWGWYAEIIQWEQSKDGKYKLVKPEKNIETVEQTYQRINH
jgi:hypothetical protein